jgi:DNA polymerase-1
MTPIVYPIGRVYEKLSKSTNTLAGTAWHIYLANPMTWIVIGFQKALWHPQDPADTSLAPYNAQQLGIARGTAQEYIDLYFARYPGVKRYMEQTRAQAKAQGYVETVFGRRLYLPDINARNKQLQQAAERAAINAPMQGTAADLVKLAMIAVQDYLDREQLATRLILQVHDELVLESPDTEVEQINRDLPGLMTSVATLRVPLKVDVGHGPNWEQAH